jgi:hypothetical protein
MNLPGNDNVCDHVFITDDDALLVTGCGNVFHASDMPAVDGTLYGVLENRGDVGHADHASATGVIAVLEDPYRGDFFDDPEEVHFFDDTTLTERSVVELPDFLEGSSYVTALGRYVFLNQAGTEAYVVGVTSSPDPDHAVITVSVP